MARPKKNPAERADMQLGVRFTADERRKLEKLVVTMGARSAGEVIRLAVAEMYGRVESDMAAESEAVHDRIDQLEARLSALEKRKGA